MKRSLLKQAFNNAVNFQGRKSDKFEVFLDELARLTKQTNRQVKLEIIYDQMNQIELVRTEQNNKSGAG